VQPNIFGIQYKQFSLANVSRLMQLHGVGKAKAAQIAAIFEFARQLGTYVEEPKRKIVLKWMFTL